MTRERTELLVVDDNRVNRLLVARTLTQLGHGVCFAEHGRQALEMLRVNPVDLVLLDIEMPEMNGVELVMRLRIDPMLGSVPIVLYSGDPNLSVIAEMLQAEGYLAKPCASHRILDEIARVLDASRPRAARGAPRHAARP